MKSIEELKELYESRLKPSLEALENKRKSIKKKINIILVIVLTSVLLGVIVFGFHKFEFLMLPIPIGIGVFIYLFYKVEIDRKSYQKEFKEQVVKKIVALINPEWQYDPYAHISEEQYKASKLFPEKYDRYKGDDLVTGKIDKTDFKISELETEYKEKGSKSTTWVTIFSGLFIHVDFNKEIKGETLVLPDTAEKLLGGFGKKLQSMSSRGQLINMENIEFEKLFVVYGTDQIEARYILTPTMMEVMVALAKKFEDDIYFSFVGSRVYIAISFFEDLFEPEIYSTGVNFDDMKKMNEQFSIIEVIINEMNLNTRIWTKD